MPSDSQRPPVLCTGGLFYAHKILCNSFPLGTEIQHKERCTGQYP